MVLLSSISTIHEAVCVIHCRHGGDEMTVIPSKEEHVRAVVINIEKPYKAFVMDEVYTSKDFLKEALEGYEDTEKYKIVII